MGNISGFTTEHLKEILIIIKEQEDRDIDTTEFVNHIKQVILSICSKKE